MATQTEPATDALYQALSSPEPDPQVVHAAIEEIRYLSGHSVIAAIEAKIDSQSARIDVKFSQIEAQGRTLEGREGVHVERHRMADNLLEERLAQFDLAIPQYRLVGFAFVPPEHGALSD